MIIDLDPVPGIGWDDVRRVALEVQALLEELGLRGWPKTSGSRGMQNVRGRVLTMGGMFGVTTPRNDASPGRGQWDLRGAYIPGRAGQCAA